jgi:cobalamin synthase
LSTESLRTYNKIEPSSYSIKDRVIQIIGFSALLLWLVVYTIKAINFNQYENGALINDGSLIKAILFLAAFFFMVSILLGMWTYYKIKRAYSNDQSKEVAKAAKWFIFGLFVLMLSILYILVPESDKFFHIYSIALVYAGKHVMGKISKNP